MGIARQAFVVGARDELRGDRVTASSESRDIHHYMIAHYKQADGNLGEAAECYERILEKDNVPAPVYRGYAKFLRACEDHDRIVSLMPRLDELFADDCEVGLAIIEALESVGEHRLSLERLFKLAHRNPHEQEVVFKAVQAYILKHEFENALVALDAFLDDALPRPNLFMFYFLKAQVYIQLGKKREALEALKKSQKLQPHFEQSWLVSAIIEEQLGNLEGAIGAFSAFLDLAGNDCVVQSHVAELVFRQKMLKDATKKAMAPPTPLDRAMVLLEEKKSSEALACAERQLKDSPSDSNARLVVLDALAADKKVKKACACLQTWIEEDPLDRTWFKVLHALCTQHAWYDEGIAVLHKVQDEHPKNIVPVMYLADLYLRIKRKPQAIYYVKRTAVMSDDSKVRVRAYYQLGCLYYEQRQFKHLKDAITQGLGEDASFAPLLNLAAYYYAGKGKDLMRAQEFIDRALKDDPNNPHYRDTQAHILYKKGEYDKAVAILDPLVTSMPRDKFIQKHGAKARARCGRV